MVLEHTLINKQELYKIIHHQYILGRRQRTYISYQKNAQYDMKLSLYSTLRLGRLSGDIIVSEKIVILAIPAF